MIGGPGPFLKTVPLCSTGDVHLPRYWRNIAGDMVGTDSAAEIGLRVMAAVPKRPCKKRGELRRLRV